MMPDDQRSSCSPARVALRLLAGEGRRTPILSQPDNQEIFFNDKTLPVGTATRSCGRSRWRTRRSQQGRTGEERVPLQRLRGWRFRAYVPSKLVDDAGNSGVQFRQPARRGWRGPGLPSRHRPHGWWGKLYEEAGPRCCSGTSRASSTSARASGTTTRCVPPRGASMRPGSTASRALISTVRTKAPAAGFRACSSTQARSDRSPLPRRASSRCSRRSRSRLKRRRRRASLLQNEAVVSRRQQVGRFRPRG